MRRPTLVKREDRSTSASGSARVGRAGNAVTIDLDLHLHGRPAGQPGALSRALAEFPAALENAALDALAFHETGGSIALDAAHPACVPYPAVTTTREEAHSMSPTRRITMLGLTLLGALGLTTLTAAAAQAALTPAEFRLQGSTFKALGIASEKFLGDIPLGEVLVGSGEGTGLNIAIHCEGGFASGDVLQGGGVTAHAEFEECKILKNSNCIIYPEEEEEGTPGVILGSANGTVVKHSGGIFGVAQSPQFTIVWFGGPKCTLPEETSIDGGIVLALPASAEQAEQEVRFTNGEEELFEVPQLHFGGERISIDQPEWGFVHLEALDNWGAN